MIAAMDPIVLVRAERLADIGKSLNCATIQREALVIIRQY
jgi:hypothetical protein